MSHIADKFTNIYSTYSTTTISHKDRVQYDDKDAWVRSFSTAFAVSIQHPDEPRNLDNTACICHCAKVRDNLYKSIYPYLIKLGASQITPSVKRRHYIKTEALC